MLYIPHPRINLTATLTLQVFNAKRKQKTLNTEMIWARIQQTSAVRHAPDRRTLVTIRLYCIERHRSAFSNSFPCSNIYNNNTSVYSFI